MDENYIATIYFRSDSVGVIGLRFYVRDIYWSFLQLSKIHSCPLAPTELNKRTSWRIRILALEEIPLDIRHQLAHSPSGILVQPRS